MNQEEARRLLAAAVRRLYDIEDAVRAVHTAAGLVADHNDVRPLRIAVRSQP
jgi:hypothetical protein